MIECIADVRTPSYLAAPCPLLPQLPPSAVGLGHTGTLVDPDDIVESVSLQEGEGVGPSETTIGQDNGPNAAGESLDDGQESLLFETVLALGGRQVVPIIGYLQERQGTTSARDGDAEHLVTNPFARWGHRVEHGPVDGETQPAGTTQAVDGVGDKSHLHGEVIDPLVIQKAPQPFESVQQIVLRVLGPALLRSRIGPGQLRENEGAFGKNGAYQRGKVDRLMTLRKGTAALMLSRTRGYHVIGKPLWDDDGLDNYHLTRRLPSFLMGGYA